MITGFKNLIELTEYFSTEQICREYLEQKRWNGNPACPFCGSVKVYRFADKKLFKCGEKECRKKFTVTVGTIFENSKIPLQKWFVAMYIVSSHKKGISSLQLAKDISVTKQTSWFMLHRIREVFRDKAPELLEGTVEIDETYIGGKVGNMHKWKQDKLELEQRNNKTKNKTMVVTILQRDGKTVSKILPDQPKIISFIKENVKEGETINTDEAHIYKQLSKKYNHGFVTHAHKEFVKGDIHTNSVEGFFSQLKRQIYGIHHFVSKKHLQRYCDEMGFRYDSRKIDEVQRFNNSLQQCETRLKYKQLIGK